MQSASQPTTTTLAEFGARVRADLCMFDTLRRGPWPQTLPATTRRYAPKDNRQTARQSQIATVLVAVYAIYSGARGQFDP